MLTSSAAASLMTTQMNDLKDKIRLISSQIPPTFFSVAD
jgi:hypothetical protein